MTNEECKRQGERNLKKKICTILSVGKVLSSSTDRTMQMQMQMHVFVNDKRILSGTFERADNGGTQNFMKCSGRGQRPRSTTTTAPPTTAQTLCILQRFLACRLPTADYVFTSATRKLLGNVMLTSKFFFHYIKLILYSLYLCRCITRRALSTVV